MNHLYVSPFYEGDIVGLVRSIGPERVLSGSDYPHPEGVAAPIDFAARLEGLTVAEVRMMMGDNAAHLFGVEA